MECQEEAERNRLGEGIPLELQPRSEREYSLWAGTTHSHAHELVPSLPSPAIMRLIWVKPLFPEHCKEQSPPVMDTRLRSTPEDALCTSILICY